MRSVALLGSTASVHYVARELIHALDNRNAPQSVAICFDADDAGRAGAARLIEHLDNSGIEVVNVEPPDGMDITDWATTNPRWDKSILETASVISEQIARRIPHDEMDIDP